MKKQQYYGFVFFFISFIGNYVFQFLQQQWKYEDLFVNPQLLTAKSSMIQATHLIKTQALQLIMLQFYTWAALIFIHSKSRVRWVKTVSFLSTLTLTAYFVCLWISHLYQFYPYIPSMHFIGVHVWSLGMVMLFALHVLSAYFIIRLRIFSKEEQSLLTLKTKILYYFPFVFYFASALFGLFMLNKI